MRSSIKINGKYRKIFTKDSFDWCLTVASIRTNYVSRLIVNSLRQVEQNFTSSCPLFGVYKIVNWTPLESFIKIMPLGLYRSCTGFRFMKGRIVCEVCLMWEFY